MFPSLDQRVLARYLTVTLLLLTALTSQMQAEDYDESWRYPTVAIPMIDKAPTIDGNINASEWGNATLFPSLLSRDPLSGDGLPASKRTWVYMAYTSDTLYWAFRQDLPEYELPVKANATKRDTGEGKDNTINIQFSTKPGAFEQFNISGNANSNIYDRRFDDGSSKYWTGDITYKARKTATGFEGEMAIPFATLDVKGTPEVGTEWNCYFYSAWRKKGVSMFAWPYVRWRRKGETAVITFAGKVPGVRFEDDYSVTLSGPEADKAKVETKLFYRPKTQGQVTYNPSVMAAVDIAQGEAATFASFSDIIAGAMDGFTPIDKPDKVGEYLLRYDVTLGDQVLAKGTQAGYVAPPLAIELTPMYLKYKKLKVAASTILPKAKSLRLSAEGVLKPKTIPFDASKARLDLPTDHWPTGKYVMVAEALDETGNVISTTNTKFEKPEPPIWWTANEGMDPLIPQPWHPIRATKDWAEVLGRTYTFGRNALPAQITTRGESILAAPITVETSGVWNTQNVESFVHGGDRSTYTATLTNADAKIRVTNQLEFDGFMLIDLEVTGNVTLEKLDLVIPLLTRHAKLMQTYTTAPGPAKREPRFTGAIPMEGIKMAPSITQWIGTDRYGLEFSIESTRDWNMAKSAEASTVTVNGDVTELRLRMISKPTKITKDQPRRIRFGLVATPTKTISEELASRRFYDDVHVALLPYDWAGFPAWHPPITDPELLQEKKDRVQSVHDRGQKLLVNGGWSVSVQDEQNAPFIHEMFGAPMRNVSYSGAKQYAYCYNTPYADFLANSFAINARNLRFDGIRFDTVTPGYPCNSLDHGCGWYDDNGTLWPSYSFFSQRNAWRRLYSAFHGGAVDNGIIYTPNASGPIMAVHSFSDHHEIGEGFYQKAKSLKEGYPPDMVRSIMTGDAYGFVTASNLKMGPLFFNERIAALLVNNAEPRFHDSRMWRMGYTAAGCPAASIWDAWDWVDRYDARFHGWWENSDYLKIDGGDNELYGSFWYRTGDQKRVLLCVTNYEKKPLKDLPVKLYYATLGMQWPIYVQDAVTGEEHKITRDGSMNLDIFGQRYRLLMISSEKPDYPDNALSANIISDAPEMTQKSWQSPEIQLEPHAKYVVSALVKIDDYMGKTSGNPNVMGKFSPSVRHYALLAVGGEGVSAIANSNRRHGPEPYVDSDLYRRSCWPQWWEPTGGWVRMYSAVQTGEDVGPAKVYVSITDEGEAAFKDIKLQKVE